VAALDRGAGIAAKKTSGTREESAWFEVE